MTVRKLIAIALILCCSTAAWIILGASVVSRSGRMDGQLSNEVAGLWGGRHVQQAPTAWLARTPATNSKEKSPDPDTPAEREPQMPETTERLEIPLSSSRLEVDLQLEHRRKGLLWFDTYTVDFSGLYKLRLPLGAQGPVQFHFEFPAEGAIYDRFRVLVNDEPVTLSNDATNGFQTAIHLPPDGEAEILIGYRSRGVDRWSYRFSPSGVTQVRDFKAFIATDFERVDFPEGSLAPSLKHQKAGGWELAWKFDSLISGKEISVDLPNRKNPGPLTARITFFAPISLLFFITVLVILGITRRQNLHPAHYFFLSAAFFAFHLLLAYLVDHLNIHLSFGIAALVSLFLVTSYLRLVRGMSRVLLQAGLAQVVFLILFSYAFFFDGYTGLTVTLGAVLTLFLLMQMTGRVDWENVFGDGVETRSPGALSTPSVL